MTASALTRPGERERLIVKLGEIDWTSAPAALPSSPAPAALMLYSIAGGSVDALGGRST